MSAMTLGFAVPATPYPVKVTQHDGSEITVFLRGDEFFHYQTTEDGYLITSDSTGLLTYAQVDEQGQLRSTGIQARNYKERSFSEKRTLKKLTSSDDISRFRQTGERMRTTARQQSRQLSQPKVFPNEGSPKSLVILVNFQDKQFITPNPQKAFYRLLNEEGYSDNGSTGSARDYFKDSSNGVFEPEFVVVGPYTLSENMSYYGTDHGGKGNDINPQQMVIEACQQAHDDGVNFADYDTDGDGYVDNIFIFYAGYNQAEGAPAETIWPHSWEVNERSFKLDGKRIFDYACSSELRSNSGTKMSGIGTFTHEFGHVLGLPDYYTTNSAQHATLGTWNIMDSGSYLNEGRTPPTYSAYDRFYLGWLTPELLYSTQDVTLEPLSTSNKAYIITEYDYHNFNGSNPNPTEFFTVENRQNIGWDSYLPGHGLLITRINYNATNWAGNTVNNSPQNMGVDIIEANEDTANPKGYTFPGTSNVDSYAPASRSGNPYNKMLVNITENGKNVIFKFNGSGELMPPVPKEATDITNEGFSANWEKSLKADHYYLSVYSISEGNSDFSEGFDNGLIASPGWKITAQTITEQAEYCGVSAPAIVMNSPTDTIQTERYIVPVGKIQVTCKPLESTSAPVALEAWNGQWIEIAEIQPSPTVTAYEYSFEDEDHYTQFRILYKENSGIKIAIDDINVSFNKRLEYILKDEKTKYTSQAILNLYPDFDYFYRVRSGKELPSNNDSPTVLVSDLSSEIAVKTKTGKKDNKLNAYVNNGDVTVFIPTANLDQTIYVYNVTGRMVYKQEHVNQNFLNISNLPQGNVYIIKISELRAKIIL